MVRDFSIDLWLCVFILLAKPHTFLWCNTYLIVVQLTFELELRWTCYKNGNKNYNNRPTEASLFKYYKVQSEREWTLVTKF